MRLYDLGDLPSRPRASIVDESAVFGRPLIPFVEQFLTFSRYDAGLFGWITGERRAVAKRRGDNTDLLAEVLHSATSAHKRRHEVGLAFGPGEQIAVAETDASIEIISVQKATPKVVASLHPSYVPTAMPFDPSGKRFACIGRDGANGKLTTWDLQFRGREQPIRLQSNW